MSNKDIKDKMSSLRQYCGDLRYSDLDCDSIESLGKTLDKAMSMRKVAVHGRGDSWTEVGPGYSPYSASPLTTFSPPMGGRWRDEMPGSGDQQINDDKDKTKSTRNDGNEDFDSTLRKRKINEFLQKVMRPLAQDFYVLKMPVREGMDPKEMKKFLGDESKYDGHYVHKTFTSYEEAIDVQRRIKDSVVEKLPESERNN